MIAADTIGTVAVLSGVIVALTKVIENLLKKRETNGHHSKSGEKSVEEWEGRMRRLHEESEERLMGDIRNLMISRNEELRKIVRDEMERKPRG